MNFDKYTFRCHMLGYIMTEPKGKSNKQKYDELLISYGKKSEALAGCTEKQVKATEKLVDEISQISARMDALKPVLDVVNLSQTCKTKLAEIYTTETTGRTKDIKSKYFEKGLAVEEDCITAYSLLTGEFHKKNKLRKNNGIIEGETDFLNLWKVIDTKGSWDIFTFDATAFKCINPIYDWQLQGYMWLFERQTAELVYCLINTPEHLILHEERKLLYEFVGSEEDYKEACLELRKKHIYDDLPLERKIRVYKVERDEEKIGRIEKRVMECRAYLNTFTEIKTDEEELQEEVAA